MGLHAPLAAEAADNDIVLFAAAAELRTIEAAEDRLVACFPNGCENMPGFDLLEDRRERIVDLLASTTADSPLGIRAKAEVLRTTDVKEDEDFTRRLSRSIVDDVLRQFSGGAPARAQEAAPGREAVGQAIEALIGFLDALEAPYEDREPDRDGEDGGDDELPFSAPERHPDGCALLFRNR